MLTQMCLWRNLSDAIVSWMGTEAHMKRPIAAALFSVSLAVVAGVTVIASVLPAMASGTP
jgi:hypothetical protein